MFRERTAGPEMRIAIGQFNELTEDKLRFAQQIGVRGVQMNTPRLPGEYRWEAADLAALVARCAEYDLVLEAIENVPIHFYDKAMLGLPGRDEQIANYQTIVRNMAVAGIPILGIHWMPNAVWRTSHEAPGRGGARVTAFHMNAIDRAGGDPSRAKVLDELDQELARAAAAAVGAGVAPRSSIFDNVYRELPGHLRAQKGRP